MTHIEPHPAVGAAPYDDSWSTRHAPVRRPARGPERGRDGERPSGVPTSALVGLGLALAAGGALGYIALRNGSEDRPADDAPWRSQRGLAREDGRSVVGRVVTIARPRSELYAFWRDFGNLARFMESVEDVRTEGQDRHVWRFQAPGGTVTVRTRITEEREGEVIAWESVEGSDIELRERVRFEDAPGGRGTRVDAEIAYHPPGGQVGRLVAKLFQREPSIQARRDLKRFKMLMETGEIATSENRRAA